MTGSKENNLQKSKQTFKWHKSTKPKQPPPISLRLTHEERTLLEKAACGVTMSAYIRSRLFGEKVAPRQTRNKAPVKDHKALAQVLGALGRSRIANNLNQLAKAVHMGALPVTPETEADLQEACAHIRQIRDMVMYALGLKPEGRT